MKATHPRCPFCAYDMSGEVRTWTTSCPLMARCPECGREAASALLFRDMPIVGVDPYAGRRTPGCFFAVALLLILGIPLVVIVGVMIWVATF
ncbi:MAG: hypothetical protein R3B57_00660 [Phycisphaerales bacterium]